MWTPAPTTPDSTNTSMSDDIIWLEIPYAEKDQAKAAGHVRWDPEQRRWYAPPQTELSGLQRWIKARVPLDCPFCDKDVAKSLGARFDGTKWYILDDQDPAPFAKWLSATL